MKAVLRKLFGQRLLSRLGAAKRGWVKSINGALASKRWLANLWFGGVKGQFSREVFAVKRGQDQHHQLNHQRRQNHARLRRNTHRLEKGLLMQPRRERFAQAYLPELVDDYCSQVTFADACSEELQWAHNVLAEYFAVVKDDTVIAHQRQKFEQVEHRFDQLKSYKPYARSEATREIPDWQQFHNLCHRRRSVRWYKQQPVPRELVEQALSTASLAPSACNRQPFDVYVIDQPNTLKQAVTLPMGTKGWAENIPMLLVFVGDMSSFEHQRDRHVPYVDASLAAMNLMLALETLGLGSCPINWPDIEPREQAMAKLLKLNDWQRPVMCMSVGFPEESGLIAFSQKRGARQLAKYID